MSNFEEGQLVRVVRNNWVGDDSSLIGLEGVVVSTSASYGYDIAVEIIDEWTGTITYGFYENELEAV